MYKRHVTQMRINDSYASDYWDVRDDGGFFGTGDWQTENKLELELDLKKLDFTPAYVTRFVFIDIDVN